MKKFLLALSSVFLLAASPISAQITIYPDSIIDNNGSIFGRDKVLTGKFNSVTTLLNEPFNSDAHSFVSDTFAGYGGMFMFDTSLSVHSTHIFTTNDNSGFVIMDAEAASADTQRVAFTSPAFSTVPYNTLKVMMNHHYKYSPLDSAVVLMASTDNTVWNVVHSFSAAAADRGTSAVFANDTFALGAQYLNKPSVRLRLVYATDSGYQWAVNNISVVADSFSYGYSFFKPATNETWDLSNIVYDGGSKVYVRKPAPAPYRFIDSIYNEELNNLQYTTYIQNYFTTSGIIAHADLTYEQIISLNDITGGTNDSLFIPTQFVLQYAGLYRRYVYPMTYNTKWSSDFRYSSNFELRGFGLSGGQFVAGLRKTHITSKDTVVGWGTLKIRDAAGDVRSPINVLQLKTVYTQEDSFLTTNNPINEQNKVAIFKSFMGTLSGLDTPANTFQYTKISYIREGEIHPLATAFMHDTFVYRIEVHAHIPWPASVPQAVAGQHRKINVYPNPVSGRLLNIEVPNAENGKWNCQIFNNLGQHVVNQSLNISTTNRRAEVEIPSTASTGIYYLHITRDGEAVATQQIEILN